MSEDKPTRFEPIAVSAESTVVAKYVPESASAVLAGEMGLVGSSVTEGNSGLRAPAHSAAVLDGSLIILHGQESRAELVILYPQDQGRTHEDRLRCHCGE